jgi:hypothetical protein
MQQPPHIFVSGGRKSGHRLLHCEAADVFSALAVSTFQSQRSTGLRLLFAS